MEAQTKKFIFAGNITYGGITQNQKVLAEYEHTGKMYILCHKNGNQIKYTSSEDIAKDWPNKYPDKKVIERPGYYFMKRLAIEIITASGEKDWWYINNPGDSFKINKVSKFWQKTHEQLSKETELCAAIMHI